MSTEIVTETHSEIELDENGAERRTHIVDCPDDKESAEAWVMEARIEGLEVTALCGATWVPQRDPKRFPICDICCEIAGIRIAGDL